MTYCAGDTTRSPGHRVIILTRCETRVFPVFEKKCTKCKTYIWNTEMTKVIVRCLLLDWNHWMSVRVMNFMSKYSVISAPSLLTFRQRLKTFLFQASFPDIITDPQ